MEIHIGGTFFGNVLNTFHAYEHVFVNFGNNVFLEKNLHSFKNTLI